MIRSILALVLLTIFTIFASCRKENVDIRDDCGLDMENYDFTFGINYSQPEEYLIPGEQSDLDNDYTEEIRNQIGTPEQSISGIKDVCHWVNQHFTFVNEGGRMIGKKTANDLYKSKTFYGCHSQALIIASVLREFGFPTVMIETASVAWAYKYREGTNEAYMGHVMTEVYLANRWVLLDNDGTLVELYNCTNPFISMRERFPYGSQGMFIYAKGSDTWDYGVQSDSDTHKKMRFFAENIICFESMLDSEDYIWSN